MLCRGPTPLIKIERTSLFKRRGQQGNVYQAHQHGKWNPRSSAYGRFWIDIPDGERERRIELQNVIERSLILCETEIFSIDESWLPKQTSLTEPKNQMELPRSLLAQEKEMIEGALKESRGRIFGPKGAAAKLGIPRSTLESKIRSLKIDKNHFRTSPET
jgi:hypothetical protein